MTKRKKHLDDMSVQLPETVVTPRGNYTDWKGNEDIIPTEQQFVDDTINKRRVEAINDMVNKDMPNLPDIPSRSIPSVVAGKLGMSDDTRKYIFGKDENGSTCIYTVTSSYKDDPVSGNKTFADNPGKYGFEEEASIDSQAGDIIQIYYEDPITGELVPHHTTMITGYNKDHEPAVTYSNGNRGEGSMVRDNDNWGRGGDHDLTTVGTAIKTYKYVGTPKLREKTKQRYNHLYGNKSNMNRLDTTPNLEKTRRIHRYGGSIKRFDYGGNVPVRDSIFNSIFRESFGAPPSTNQPRRNTFGSILNSGSFARPQQTPQRVPQQMPQTPQIPQPNLDLNGRYSMADPSWHSWWLKGRQKQFRENYNSSSKEQQHYFSHFYDTDTINKQLDNLRKSRVYSDIDALRKDSGFKGSKRGFLGFNYGYTPGGGSFIWLDPKGGNITNSKGKSMRQNPTDIYIHEGTHALVSRRQDIDKNNKYNKKYNYGESSPQESKIDRINKEAGENLYSEQYYKTREKDVRYYNNSAEVYAELMNSRHGLGLTPDHVVSRDEIKKWRSEGKLPYSLSRYSDDVLLRYYNEVASNTNPLFDPKNMINAFGNNNIRFTNAVARLS